MLLSSQRDTHSKCKRRPAMKKNNTEGKGLTQDQKVWKGPITIGMDLGDRTSRYCILDGNGETVREGSVRHNQSGHDTALGQLKRSRIALEVGTHSLWISRLLKAMGHEVIVANPRQLKLITESSRKNDRVDAEML